MTHSSADLYEQAAQDTIELGNRIADANPEADLWDIGDGLLAGAVQYWLYSRQPCGDPQCESCGPLSMAEARLAELQQLVEKLARESEYFHAPGDINAGRA